MEISFYVKTPNYNIYQEVEGNLHKSNKGFWMVDKIKTYKISKRKFYSMPKTNRFIMNIFDNKIHAIGNENFFLKILQNNGGF